MSVEESIEYLEKVKILFEDMADSVRDSLDLLYEEVVRSEERAEVKSSLLDEDDAAEEPPCDDQSDDTRSSLW